MFPLLDEFLASPSPISNSLVFDLHNAQETYLLGEQVGRHLRAGQLITLSGPLGAGKTTFTQGLARGLGLPAEVVSPTFVLMNEYPPAQGAPGLLHLDAYRLEDLEWEELRDAGIEDFIYRTDAVKLVEWPEMIARWLPLAFLTIQIEIVEEGRRFTLRV